MSSHHSGEQSSRRGKFGRRVWLWCRWAGVTVALSVVAACGGGGGGEASGTDTPPTQVLNGTLVSGLVVPSASEVSAATVTTSADGSSLVLSHATGSLQNVKDGQVVMLSASEAQGLPLGYTGKAALQSDGTIKLQPAGVADVFKSLRVDFDSARDGGQMGLIVPTGGKMAFSQSPASSRQAGLDWTLCQVGLEAVVESECAKGALKATITLEQPIKVKSKDGKSETTAKLYATIGFDKFSVRTKVDFDIVKYPGTGGFNLLESGMVGEWSGSIGIKLDDDKFSASIPSWNELIRSDGKNIWDENTRVKFGKYFELSGLNGDDKKGLIPIGGFYFTPASSTAVPFGGDLSAAQLGRIKSMGVVVFVYIDFAGNLSLSGDLKFFEATGGSFNRGFRIQRVDGSLTSTIVDEKTDANLFAPRVNGKIELSQNIGLAAGLDVLVAGVRPASVKATLIGVNLSATLEGQGGYRLSPQPAGLDGSLCLHMGGKVFSGIEANVAASLKIDGGWIESFSKQMKFGPAEHIAWEDSLDACMNSFTLPLTVVGMSADPTDPTKTQVTLSLSEAYNNAALRAQVERWKVYEAKLLRIPKIYDADLTNKGEFTASLKPGKYTFTVEALHQELMDGSGQPLVVVRSMPVPITVAAMPVADFSADIVGGDCTKLQLTSKAAASSGTTLNRYQWTVQPATGAALTQQGAALRSATFTLPACGSVSVTHTVEDSVGHTAMVARNVNTSAYLAAVTSVTPAPVTPTVGQLATFTVVGQNLPLTAVFSVADASACHILTKPARSSTGFTASCTMGNTVGSKLITIKTDTQANGGKVIDATRTVTVVGTRVAGKLPDTGITTTQCYAAGSDALVSCTSAAALALNSLQDGMVGRDVSTPSAADGKLGFSYSMVGSYSKEECVKDNLTGLTWEGKPTTGLRAAANTYTNYGDNRAGDASAYVAAVNATALCGYTDWRLPTKAELQSLVDYSMASPGPMIDGAWFPNTQSYVYWTGTGYAGHSGYAWDVDFYHGDVLGNDRYDGRNHVRLVR